ncbi:hypothetical protein CC1G_05026 [Coprinopsis cinerea okayama7|uniref:Uncharacterized protein n=1 Tax=Coprinopsis cinerea (strain Okayama-7 / 130 / ATCC MYA-4618 / FGSC 9003) TaxID=240176 RepID=A8NSK7_COPC7|nr:hypothetical protein CC1G_05026 [Coprinopsis cinerea okayama7\|eukprot:XP_001836033.2 hypothetical protein CC1G_05026 [Coprinopsis cinerea okayama7\
MTLANAFSMMAFPTSVLLMAHMLQPAVPSSVYYAFDELREAPRQIFNGLPTANRILSRVERIMDGVDALANEFSSGTLFWTFPILEREIRRREGYRGPETCTPIWNASNYFVLYQCPLPGQTKVRKPKLEFPPLPLGLPPAPPRLTDPHPLSYVVPYWECPDELVGSPVRPWLPQPKKTCEYPRPPPKPKAQPVLEPKRECQLFSRTCCSGNGAPYPSWHIALDFLLMFMAVYLFCPEVVCETIKETLHKHCPRSAERWFYYLFPSERKKRKRWPLSYLRPGAPRIPPAQPVPRYTRPPSLYKPMPVPMMTEPEKDPLCVIRDAQLVAVPWIVHVSLVVGVPCFNPEGMVFDLLCRLACWMVGEVYTRVFPGPEPTIVIPPVKPTVEAPVTPPGPSTRCVPALICIPGTPYVRRPRKTVRDRYRVKSELEEKVERNDTPPSKNLKDTTAVSDSLVVPEAVDLKTPVQLPAKPSSTTDSQPNVLEKSGFVVNDEVSAVSDSPVVDEEAIERTLVQPLTSQPNSAPVVIVETSVQSVEPADSDADKYSISVLPIPAELAEDWVDVANECVCIDAPPDATADTAEDHGTRVDVAEESLDVGTVCATLPSSMPGSFPTGDLEATLELRTVAESVVELAPAKIQVDVEEQRVTGEDSIGPMTPVVVLSPPFTDSHTPSGSPPDMYPIAIGGLAWGVGPGSSCSTSGTTAFEDSNVTTENSIGPVTPAVVFSPPFTDSHTPSGSPPDTVPIAIGGHTWDVSPGSSCSTGTSGMTSFSASNLMMDLAGLVEGIASKIVNLADLVDELNADDSVLDAPVFCEEEGIVVSVLDSSALCEEEGIVVGDLAQWQEDSVESAPEDSDDSPREDSDEPKKDSEVLNDCNALDEVHLADAARLVAFFNAELDAHRSARAASTIFWNCERAQLCDSVVESKSEPSQSDSEPQDQEGEECELHDEQQFDHAAPPSQLVPFTRSTFLKAFLRARKRARDRARLRSELVLLMVYGGGFEPDLVNHPRPTVDKGPIELPHPHGLFKRSRGSKQTRIRRAKERDAARRWVSGMRAWVDEVEEEDWEEEDEEDDEDDEEYEGGDDGESGEEEGDEEEQKGLDEKRGTLVQPEEEAGVKEDDVEAVEEAHQEQSPVIDERVESVDEAVVDQVDEPGFTVVMSRTAAANQPPVEATSPSPARTEAPPSNQLRIEEPAPLNRARVEGATPNWGRIATAALDQVRGDRDAPRRTRVEEATSLNWAQAVSEEPAPSAARVEPRTRNRKKGRDEPARRNQVRLDTLRSNPAWVDASAPAPNWSQVEAEPVGGARGTGRRGGRTGQRQRKGPVRP